MTKETLESANKLKGRIEFYTHFEKVLKATGAANIDFTALKDDLEELEKLRDSLLAVFSERKQSAETDFDKI